MFGIVVSSSVRVAGNRFDEAIATYVRRKYNLMIGEQTAEQLKISIGSALKLDEPLSMEVRGRDQVARPATHDHGDFFRNHRCALRAAVQHLGNGQVGAGKDASRARLRTSSTVAW